MNTGGCVFRKKKKKTTTRESSWDLSAAKLSKHMAMKRPHSADSPKWEGKSCRAHGVALSYLEGKRYRWYSGGIKDLIAEGFYSPRCYSSWLWGSPSPLNLGLTCSSDTQQPGGFSPVPGWGAVDVHTNILPGKHIATALPSFTVSSEEFNSSLTLNTPLLQFYHLFSHFSVRNNQLIHGFQKLF